MPFNYLYADASVEIRGSKYLPREALDSENIEDGIVREGFTTEDSTLGELQAGDEFQLTTAWHEAIVSVTIGAAWISALFGGWLTVSHSQPLLHTLALFFTLLPSFHTLTLFFTLSPSSSHSHPLLHTPTLFSNSCPLLHTPALFFTISPSSSHSYPLFTLLPSSSHSHPLLHTLARFSHSYPLLHTLARFSQSQPLLHTLALFT
uniref:Uncharacterized protein n=1 Tax=Timema monikensis TaxID=170555 RepID=A0A7R9E959_9NEOP|nr:unnamed protein product [Timema monikensis]